MDFTNILIVEDDVTINNMMCEALSQAGYNCTQAFSGTEGLLNIQNTPFELAIFDLMMPGISGEKLLYKTRELVDMPVIIVSAKVDIDDRLNLLDMGADDYLVKPFEIRELIARVKALLRRNNKVTTGNNAVTLTIGELSLNPETFVTKICNNSITLTRQEFKILELLMLHPSKVFTKQEIYEYAWDDLYIGYDKTINVHISNIRSKLKKYTSDEYIETVWGIGFKIVNFDK